MFLPTKQVINIFFIPGIIMIIKDKSYLYVSMHMIVHMYTRMVSHKQSSDLRHRGLGLLCTYRRLKSLAHGGLAASPTTHRRAQRCYPYSQREQLESISWAAKGYSPTH